MSGLEEQIGALGISHSSVEAPWFCPRCRMMERLSERCSYAVDAQPVSGRYHLVVPEGNPYEETMRLLKEFWDLLR